MLLKTEAGIANTQTKQTKSPQVPGAVFLPAGEGPSTPMNLRPGKVLLCSPRTCLTQICCLKNPHPATSNCSSVWVILEGPLLNAQLHLITFFGVPSISRKSSLSGIDYPLRDNKQHNVGLFLNPWHDVSLLRTLIISWWAFWYKQAMLVNSLFTYGFSLTFQELHADDFRKDSHRL